MNNPIAKSPHTVTVLVRVARGMMSRNPTFCAFDAIHAALDLLGLYGAPDDHVLANQAYMELRATL